MENSPQNLYFLTEEPPVIVLAFANDQVDNTRYLRELNQELREIKQALRSIKQKNLCQIEILVGATLNDILQVFEDYQNRIAIFHYGGHADGFQLLLESETNKNEVAHGEGFTEILQKLPALELVFLNGCSTHEYAQKLIEKSAISVIATENAIDDQVAREFAVQFYRNLASEKTYFQAYQQAENVLKTRKGGNQFRALYRKNALIQQKFPWNFAYADEFYFIKHWTLIGNGMNNKTFTKPTRQLLRRSPEKALNKILTFLEDQEDDFAQDLYDKALEQDQKWQEVSDEMMSGTISVENASLKKSKVMRAITQLLRQIEKLPELEPPKTEEKKQQPTNSGTSSSISSNTHSGQGFDLKQFKAELYDLLDRLEFVEVFEKIEENQARLKYNKSAFTTLQFDMIDGQGGRAFNERVRGFVKMLVLSDN